ncbi:probable 3-deoxy-D-manno-octulosonic acid transferase, mitochondrial isoform X2 [Quercus suber]|uniref:probable 3-deoxy-D-manno-octulosonic acid transferase, mitochondrial isoform X1 n=1 Tax=Quercus suber TaxID=58331 RepID=UPI0032E0107D
MAATEAAGKLAYRIYRAVSYGAEPVVNLHLRWRRLRGREHSLRWTERLGLPSLSRPTGPLLWFHAVSLGEGITAIPIIKECMKQRPDVNVLMTTTTVSAFEVISKRLPSGVIYQFAPLDTPSAVGAFLDYWKPNAIILIESELWPNLIMGASENGIVLALLNARMSSKSFKIFSGPLLLPLISLMLSKFSLIVPLSTMQAIHFQLLQASPYIIKFSGDLKYAVEEFDASEGELRSIQDLKLQLAHRQVWMASSIHRGEEEIMLGVHRVLTEMHPDIVTILVPRDPQHGLEIAQELQKAGQNVALRSRQENLKPGTNIYVVDTLGELRYLYRLTPIAVVGGSFFSGLAGHNIFEAAAAGCAVLTGCHVGHFSHMVLEMQRLNPLSVMQVSGKLELEKALKELFSDAKVLEARRMAAKQAFRALSTGIVANVWSLLNVHVLNQALC